MNGGTDSLPGRKRLRAVGVVHPSAGCAKKEMGVVKPAGRPVDRGGTKMLEDEWQKEGKDIQTCFSRLAAKRFIQTQRLQRTDMCWSGRGRAGHGSEMFNAALAALLDGRQTDAERLIRSCPRSCLLWPLLLSEAEYFAKVFGLKAAQPDIRKWPFSMAPQGGCGKRFSFGVIRGTTQSRVLKKAAAAFEAFKKRETTYGLLPVKHCVVCATMSAGKSTFVNALLGRDILPARNEATTAKVTSVYDKDGAEGVAGFALDHSGQWTEGRSGLDLDAVDTWNQDPDVARIFLEGNLDGIANGGFKLAVHDTPGTNNSRNRGHHDTTMRFLRGHGADAIVYVANGEHLCTTNEKTFLEELAAHTAAGRSTPVLFVLNKADSLDLEKESLEGVVGRYKMYLSELGYRQPVVLPVSSEAARLFKMALTGREGQFTTAERDKFSGVVKCFTRILAFGRRAWRQTGAGGKPRPMVDRVSVNDVAYPADVLQTALSHTGMPEIEATLESMLAPGKRKPK